MADATLSSESTLQQGGVALTSGATSSTETVPFASITFFPRDESGDLFIPSFAHTLSGFRQWAVSEDFPDRGQFTFVAGELIVDMSPEYLELHNFLKTEITSVIHRRATERKLGRVFADRALFSNEAAGVSTEPDASFAAYSTLESGRCRIVRGARPGVSDELVGSLDWVLEIVSPSSVRKDTKLLFDAYFRAGISEYWLIDARGDELMFQIFVPGQNGYVTVKPRKGWLASPIFDGSFRLSRQRAKDGLWDYTLHVQETA